MRFSSDLDELLCLAFGLTHREKVRTDVRAFAKSDTAAFVAQEQQVEKFQADHLQRIALKKGLHAVQTALYETGGDIEDLIDNLSQQRDVPKTNWELIALVHILGLTNIAFAQRLLPSKLCDLANEFSTASASRQAEICEEVFIFLSHFQQGPSERECNLETFDPLTSWHKDFSDQRPTRIFPSLFLRNRSFEPNCLGKAQMLIAFFELTGARAFGITPIMSSERSTHDVLLAISQAILEVSSKNGVSISRALRERFAKREKAVKAFACTPCRFHMALAVELRDRSWFIVDPHLQVRSRLPASHEFSLVTTLVEIFEPVIPGFCSLASSSREIAKASERACMEAGKILDIASTLASNWAKNERCLGAALPAFAFSPALDVLVKNGIGVPEHLKEPFREVLRKKSGGEVVLQLVADQSPTKFRFRTSPERTISPREQVRLEIAFCIFTTLGSHKSGSIAELLQSSDFSSRGITKVFESLHSLAYVAAATEMGVTGNGGRLMHPIVEVYSPSFRVGIELLSHLNARWKKSNRVIMELASICGGQHQLALAATEALRESTTNISPFSHAAIKSLISAPVRLPLAEQALNAIKEMGLLETSIHSPCSRTSTRKETVCVQA